MWQIKGCIQSILHSQNTVINIPPPNQLHSYTSLCVYVNTLHSLRACLFSSAFVNLKLKKFIANETMRPNTQCLIPGLQRIDSLSFHLDSRQWRCSLPDLNRVFISCGCLNCVVHSNTMFWNTYTHVYFVKVISLCGEKIIVWNRLMESNPSVLLSWIGLHNFWNRTAIYLIQKLIHFCMLLPSGGQH